MLVEHGMREERRSPRRSRARVADPGVKIAPAGVTVRELIDEYCGGMAEGHEFYAYLPGGASGGILPASMSDIPLDFGTLEKYGCFIGSAAVVILSDKDSVRLAALNLMRFFEDESCGQCTPCRVGNAKLLEGIEMLERGELVLQQILRVVEQPPDQGRLAVVHAAGGRHPQQGSDRAGQNGGAHQK